MRGFPDRAAQAARDAQGDRRDKDPVTACLLPHVGRLVLYLRGDWAAADDYVERLLGLPASRASCRTNGLGVGLRGDLQRQRGEGHKD